MTIREKVARAILLRRSQSDYRHTDVKGNWLIDHDKEIATTAITAFLEAAAEQGWHMRPDEATEAMAHAGNGFKYTSDYTREEDAALRIKYRAMLAVSPEFEWDK